MEVDGEEHEQAEAGAGSSFDFDLDGKDPAELGVDVGVAVHNSN